MTRATAGIYKLDPPQCPSGDSSTRCNYSSIIYFLFRFFLKCFFRCDPAPGQNCGGPGFYRVALGNWLLLSIDSFIAASLKEKKKKNCGEVSPFNLSESYRLHLTNWAPDVKCPGVRL